MPPRFWVSSSMLLKYLMSPRLVQGTVFPCRLELQVGAMLDTAETHIIWHKLFEMMNGRGPACEQRAQPAAGNSILQRSCSLGTEECSAQQGSLS